MTTRLLLANEVDMSETEEKVVVQRPYDMDGEMVWLMLAKTAQIRERLLELFKYTYMKELKRSDVKIINALQRGAVTVADAALIRGISRQAAHKALSRLVDLGYIELVLLPNNAKTLQIKWTEKGQAFQNDTRRALVDLERDLAEKFGNEAMKRLESFLRASW